MSTGPSTPAPAPRPYRPASRIRAFLSAALFFTLMLLITAVYFVVCIFLFWSRHLRILTGNVYGKIVGPIVFLITGIRPQIHGRGRFSSGPPAIYLCNHTATIDMWVGMWLCPFGGCGVAKKEIWKVPFLGIAYILSGHLRLDRGNRDAAIASMAKAAATIRKHGLSLWMWPEGTRSRSGRLLPLKKGFVHLAVATGLPIVPIVFHDADLRWPGGSLRPSSGPLRIEVLDDIDTTGWSAERAGEHTQQLWQVFQDALGERQKALPATGDDSPTEAQK